MSCPYLEKGWRARCRAFGNQGIGIKLPDMEDACFSGEFSECAFLFAPGPGPGKKALGPVSPQPWRITARPFTRNRRRHLSVRIPGAPVS
jgi:hypothetical protein